MLNSIPLSTLLDFLHIQSFENIALYWYVILFFAALFGGLVGSLSGGAGMITMPLLLLSGINPLAALATNKLQACVGSFTGAYTYYSQSNITLNHLCIILALIFASAGAISVQFVKAELLAKILPFVMIAIGLYFLFSRKISDTDRAKPQNKFAFYGFCALISFYGGFLGVGIGTLMLTLLVSLGGYGLSKALAHSRSLVFSINISSTLFFILSGNVLWLLGLLMCIGQAIGASLGAKLALKHGAKIIKPFVICICFGISAQLIIKEFFR
ncbi:TSUP family transporter [Helicobacter himalayensis]|uniref:TSUP family transporter n=1 Tax=Helicobacter himalayensis TaxID=1591088 RepID=UPI0008304A0C|nr:TSUP family transporter [Helicobacter himalayensis]